MLLRFFGIAINRKFIKLRRLRDFAFKCIVHSVFRGPGDCEAS